ncbi:MAG: hypothetical protein Q8O14_14090 [bacterium]|jgi:hypothetical protein|nr:hypothetical protein [bacterium]
MTDWPAMLLLGATGRNAGKTSFACALIRRLSEQGPILGLKVTVIRDEEGCCPRGGVGCGVCGALAAPFELAKEVLPGSDKDTRRMLAAGARGVWWLKVRREALAEGIDALRQVVDPGLPIVCESNSLRLALKPGLFLMIHHTTCAQIKETARAVLPLADRLVLSDGQRHDPDPSRIRFHQGHWEQAPSPAAESHTLFFSILTTATA